MKKMLVLVAVEAAGKGIASGKTAATSFLGNSGYYSRIKNIDDTNG